jgi:hypothetical protein
VDILRAIGERRVQAGRPYLVRFLGVDADYEASGLVRQAAAFSLAELGGKKSLKKLMKAADESPVSDLDSIATALGLLGDRGAVPTLEKLARSADTDTRKAAISALGNYCGATSKALAVSNLADSDDWVRNSATWFVATCGRGDDDRLLVPLLSDPAEMVRLNALRGLVRTRSRAACDRLQSLLDDSDISVHVTAREYRTVCGVASDDVRGRDEPCLTLEIHPMGALEANRERLDLEYELRNGCRIPITVCNDGILCEPEWEDADGFSRGVLTGTPDPRQCPVSKRLSLVGGEILKGRAAIDLFETQSGELRVRCEFQSFGTGEGTAAEVWTGKVRSDWITVAVPPR